jgi:hypothetical protein
MSVVAAAAVLKDNVLVGSVNAKSVTGTRPAKPWRARIVRGCRRNVSEFEFADPPPHLPARNVFLLTCLKTRL